MCISISYEEKEDTSIREYKSWSIFQKIGNYVIAINPLSPLSY